MRIYGLHGPAVADPADFLESLAAAVLPVGGEASRGGARVVWELLSVEYFSSDSNAKAMLDAGVAWAKSTGRRLVDYEIG